jgi:hypothetical protein
MQVRTALRLVFGALALLGLASAANAEALSASEARAIAKEATIYGFPMVDNYRILYSYFVDKDGPEYKGPWNTLINNARVYTPEDRAIQTPNSDTPYSYVGADLRAEPLVFSLPAVEKQRYYSLQFIDLYTFNFAYLGSRATGNEAGSYMLVGPGWHGEKPPGIKDVIRSETDIAFVFYRTQLFDAADIDAVKRVQAGYKVETLSQFLGKPAPPPAPPIDWMKPLSAADERISTDFFSELNFLLQFAPVDPSETALRARFAKLGLGSGAPFDLSALSPDIRKALDEGMVEGWDAFNTYKKTMIDTGKFTSADGFGTRAFLKNDYMARMAGAILGIYGNSKDEAIYPAYFTDAKGRPLTGADAYEMHFAPGELPPVNAFWSLTMYELPQSLLYANTLDRYLINSAMLPKLKKDADGGLTLYVQHESPGAEKESNWLPAPAGAFLSVMRLYWPKSEALDGKWKAPPLVRIADSADSDAGPAGSAQPSVPVNADNFVRAESDLYFAGTANDGGFGTFFHNREPTPIDRQVVVRMNRDTLYSGAVFDLDAGPVTITMPEAGKRFLSMQVIDEDEYTHGVYYGGGRHTLTRRDIGTRYVIVAVRILVDPEDPKDLAAVHALQDQIDFDQPGGPGDFEIPKWDQASQKVTRNALLALAAQLPDTRGMFGAKDAVDPVRHLIGAASAWGGNPEKDALYLTVTPAKNDGKTIYKLDVGDVPVDGFWSISVYDKQGYFAPNSRKAYTLNDITAKKGADGSVAIQFGGCEADSVNCLPITPGWNYLVRLYRPRPEILSGKWTFPEARPAQ